MQPSSARVAKNSGMAVFSLDFAAVAPLPEHQTGICGKRTHQMQRCGIHLACAPTTFTVNGHQRREDRSDPAPKGDLKLRWINYSASRE